jgi:hypothetical protein
MRHHCRCLFIVNKCIGCLEISYGDNHPIVLFSVVRKNGFHIVKYGPHTRWHKISQKLYVVSKFLEPEGCNEASFIPSTHKYYAPQYEILSQWWPGACVMGTLSLHLYQYRLIKSWIYEYFEACNKINVNYIQKCIPSCFTGGKPIGAWCSVLTFM